MNELRGVNEWRAGACLAAGLITTVVLHVGGGFGTQGRWLDTLMAGFWYSPVLTWPGAILASRWLAARGQTWPAQNRWNYAGFLTGTTMAVGLIFALLTGAVTFVANGFDVTHLAGPPAFVMLQGTVSALPLWFMAVGLIVGPGARRPHPSPGPQDRRTIVADR